MQDSLVREQQRLQLRGIAGDPLRYYGIASIGFVADIADSLQVRAVVSRLIIPYRVLSYSPHGQACG
jgi:hypothetical protein